MSQHCNSLQISPLWNLISSHFWVQVCEWFVESATSRVTFEIPVTFFILQSWCHLSDTALALNLGTICTILIETLKMHFKMVISRNLFRREIQIWKHFNSYPSESFPISFLQKIIFDAVPGYHLRESESDEQRVWQHRTSELFVFFQPPCITYIIFVCICCSCSYL